MSQLAALVDDGAEDDAPQPNQLALVADGPLLPPSERLLSSRLKAGETRRQGCGVCRTCLFYPNRLACLATQSAAQLTAKAAVQQPAVARHAHAKALERQLDKQQQQASGVSSRLVSSFLPPQSCRLCKCADHTVAACPLNTRLSSAAPAEVTWADELDPHMRAVLLAVQQLASARVYARSRGSPASVRFGALTPEHLQRVEAALRAVRDAAETHE